jgi:hypothetical protein
MQKLQPYSTSPSLLDPQMQTLRVTESLHNQPIRRPTPVSHRAHEDEQKKNIAQMHKLRSTGKVPDGYISILYPINCARAAAVKPTHFLKFPTAKGFVTGAICTRDLLFITVVREG